MTAILGISTYYHDSAACLVIDGETVGAAQEERFSRKKHDHGFPTHAITYCFEEAGLSLDQLDYVGRWSPPNSLELPVLEQRSRGTRYNPVPPASAPLRRKRAVAHDVEAQFSTVVTPALGAGHPVDRVHRSSVPGGNPRFSPKISEVKATDQQRPAQAPPGARPGPVCLDRYGRGRRRCGAGRAASGETARHHAPRRHRAQSV